MNIHQTQPESDLEAYRQRLEELVQERTAELTILNAQLQREVRDRKQAEEVLGQLSHRYETILEAAAEGICGIDRHGRFAFVNRAAAEMLGYGVDELVGNPCHAIWHRSRGDGSPYPEDECPLSASYLLGIANQGDEQVFWRKDGTSFPVLYASSPTFEKDVLTGAVVVFRDITRRKCDEAEIARHTADLAAQNAVAATLSRSLDLQTLLGAALDVVLSVVQMDLSLIYLLNPDGELVLQSSRGLPAQGAMQPSEDDWSCCLAISAEAVVGLQAIVRPEPLSSAEDRAPGASGEGLDMVISVPLISNDRALGALTLGSRKAGPISASRLALVTAIGQQIGMAIENARLYQAAEHSAEVLTLLHEASIDLTSTFDADEIYGQMTERSARLLGCEMACILTWDGEDRTARLIAGYRIGAAETDLLRSGPGASGCLQDLITCHPSMAISDAQADPRVPLAWREGLGLRALLCVSIRGAEESLGTLFLMDRRASRRWRTEELELIESFVNRAAVALMNASLHKQLEWAAALEERQRIAADMHDGLAQTVSILGLQIDEVIALVASGSGGVALERLSGVRETVDRVSADVRRSIASIHRDPEPQLSLQDMLSKLRDQLSVQDGPDIDYVSTIPEPLFLPPAQDGDVLLVVQEALLNARRHAQAQRISLLLERHDSAVRLTVEDDGQGFDPSAWPKSRGNRFGLSIMRARAAHIGARLQVDSAPGRGARVILILPRKG